jgi:ketosteroid isomerase-like protein
VPRVTDAGTLVRDLYEAYQRRDWDSCAPLIHPEATYDLPNSNEYVEGGDELLAYQRDYPEPWGELSVLRVIAAGDQAAAEITVTGGREGDFRMAALWTLKDGLLHRCVEYWALTRRAGEDA